MKKYEPKMLYRINKAIKHLNNNHSYKQLKLTKIVPCFFFCLLKLVVNDLLTCTLYSTMLCSFFSTMLCFFFSLLEHVCFLQYVPTSYKSPVLMQNFVKGFASQLAELIPTCVCMYTSVLF